MVECCGVCGYSLQGRSMWVCMCLVCRLGVVKLNVVCVVRVGVKVCALIFIGSVVCCGN